MALGLAVDPSLVFGGCQSGQGLWRVLDAILWYPSAVICPKCSSPVPEDQAFCGKCGYKLEPDSIASLSERLASVEVLLAADSRSKGTEQKYLELETSEKIVSRVMEWTKMFLYWSAIPGAMLLLVLGIIFGKGALDLHNIAANAKESVNGIVRQAREEASTAKETADDALNTSKQVGAETLETKRRIGELKSQVEGRSSEVQRLGDQIRIAQQKIESQSQQVQHLNQQVQAITTAKNVTDIHKVYPLYGQHVANSQSDGWLDPTTKPAGVRYVDLNLAIGGNPSAAATLTPGLSDEKIGKAISALSDRKYRVFVGYVYTNARTSVSAQPIGMGLDAGSCGYWPEPPSQPSCIIYFNESLKGAAIEVRDLFKDVQAVPDERVLYVEPKRLSAQKRELLTLSAVDIVVVLSDVLH